LVGDEARKERTTQVIAQLPVDVSTFLLNEKREWVTDIETRNNVRVVVLPDQNIETPHFHLRRVRDDELDLPENSGTSVEMVSNLDDKPLINLDLMGKKQKIEIKIKTNQKRKKLACLPA